MTFEVVVLTEIRPVPSLTGEQRAQALEKSLTARRARADVKNQQRASPDSLGKVIGQGQTDEMIGRMRVCALLESLPRIGKTRARQLMVEVGIADNRRIRGLGPVQIAQLLQRLDR
jgi:hypothetical protein